MELGVAIYAAIVGSIALGWEIFKWTRARRPDVRVRYADGSDPEGDWIEAIVINKGTHPVRLAYWSAFDPDADGYTMLDVTPEDSVVAPGDAVRLRAFVEDLPDVRSSEEVAVWVELTTGDEFRSERFVWEPSSVFPRPKRPSEGID
jgi:hypothetical protein